MRRIFNVNFGAAAGAIAALAVCLGLAGCGGGGPADNKGAKMTGATKTSTAPSQETAAAIPKTAFLSVFSTNNPRDPFHPALKPKTPEAAATSAVERETEQALLAAALQAGFQGIYGSPDSRELMVHGVLMREKQERTISVNVGGQPRRVKVRAVRIYRNAAELQVEGLSQPISVPKARQ